MDTEDIVKILEAMRGSRDPALLPEQLGALRAAIRRVKDHDPMKEVTTAAEAWLRHRPPKREESFEEEQLRKAIEKYRDWLRSGG